MICPSSIFAAFLKWSWHVMTFLSGSVICGHNLAPRYIQHLRTANPLNMLCSIFCKMVLRCLNSEEHTLWLFNTAIVIIMKNTIFKPTGGLRAKARREMTYKVCVWLMLKCPLTFSSLSAHASSASHRSHPQTAPQTPVAMLATIAQRALDLPWAVPTALALRCARMSESEHVSSISAT